MIQALDAQPLTSLGIESNQPAPRTAGDFARLFGDVASSDQPATTAQPADTAGTQQNDMQPDVQAWLNSYYAQAGSNVPTMVNVPYEAPAGAPDNYTANSVYGPDQIFQQALSNQCGNEFAAITGTDAANYTSQLPGVPSEQAQQTFDSLLATENAERLASGQPIDTAAYWSDPGSVNVDGTTYTAQQLGYCGACQSSGTEPVWIPAGTYPGTTITGGRYYTPAELQAASGVTTTSLGMQYNPGSWSETAAS